MPEVLSSAWPWYVCGPLIGLVVPALLLLGNKPFGISNNLRHLCAVVAPGRVEFFQYDWKRAGLWNLSLLAGIVAGGAIAAHLLGTGDVAITAETRKILAAAGLQNFSGLAPIEIFSWSNLLTLRGLVWIVGGGFLVGFGSSYAGGCTSGHAIFGLATFQPASLVASLAFFAGGLLCTFFILPLLF